MLSFVFPILVLGAAVAQSPAVQLHTTACPELVAGKPISVTNLLTRPACVMVSVAPEKALQVVADYPENVALHVSGANREFLIDGSQFGRETLTLTAGEYRIGILPAGETTIYTRLTVHMSLNPLPLRAAITWQNLARSHAHAPFSGAHR